MILRDEGRRLQVLQTLESNRVETRLLFAGNITRQPAFTDLKYRVSGELRNTDKNMNDGSWVGIWPGLGKEHIEYIAEQIKQAVRE